MNTKKTDRPPPRQYMTGAPARPVTDQADAVLPGRWPQFLPDPESGEPALAVLPVEDYRTLVETAQMAEDVAAYDAATASDEESFPIELLDRLLTGDSRVRVYREYRNMTQSALAKAANLQQATISQIETGGRTGTVDALSRLARALDVDLENLVPRPAD